MADASDMTTLLRGTHATLRRWDEQAGDAGQPHTRPYETLGYVVEGRLEVTVDGAAATYGAGEAYHVPAGAERRYRVLADLVAVEAIAPAEG